MSKTMIISGASRGIGAAIAMEASEKGFNLVLNARSKNALDKMAGSLSRGSTGVAVVSGDVSEQAVCERITGTAVERFGGVDVLVNNAGILEPVGPLDAVDADAWVQNLIVNVAAPVRLTKCALSSLRRRQGCVLNISSGAAVKAVRGWSAYCTSKAALNHFNRMLSAEYPEITAVAISPGMTATEMQRTIRERGKGNMPEDEYRRFVTAYESGELRSPERVARAIVAIALNPPRALNGEFVTVEDPRVASLLVG